MVEQNVASAADIDTAMKLGYGHPIGPLELTDLVGLDVRLGIAEYLASAIGPSFTPPRILSEKVAAGKLGKKSGEGFLQVVARTASACSPCGISAAMRCGRSSWQARPSRSSMRPGRAPRSWRHESSRTTRHRVLMSQKLREGWKLRSWSSRKQPTRVIPGAAPLVFDAREPAIEATILADPDVDEPYRIYGDWLQQQGDPRGELIMALYGHALGHIPVTARPQTRSVVTPHDRYRDYFVGDMQSADDSVLRVGLPRDDLGLAAYVQSRRAGAGARTRTRAAVIRFVRRIVLSDADEEGGRRPGRRDQARRRAGAADVASPRAPRAHGAPSSTRLHRGYRHYVAWR